MHKDSVETYERIKDLKTHARLTSECLHKTRMLKLEKFVSPQIINVKSSV